MMTARQLTYARYQRYQIMLYNAEKEKQKTAKADKQTITPQEAKARYLAEHGK